MTDKYIVSKSEIEAAFKTVSQCKTADYCEGFNDALKAVLDNAQVVNSEPEAFRYQYIEYGKWHFIEKFDDDEVLEYTKLQYPQFKSEALFTTPQPAPDTVPRAEYNKLLDALREAKDDIADWGSYAPEFFQIKHDLAGDMAKCGAIIAEAEGK